MVYLFLLLSILLTVLVQIKLKDLAVANNGVMLNALLSPELYGVLFIYAIALFAWFYSASKIEFSVILPMNSLTVILGGVIGYLYYNEDFSPLKFLAYFFILLGIFILYFQAKT